MTQVTVECPLCKKVISIPDYDSVSRSDALGGHILRECPYGPAKPREGPPLPRKLGIFSKWPWNWRK